MAISEKPPFQMYSLSSIWGKNDVRVMIILKIQTTIMYWFQRFHESKDNVGMMIKIHSSRWAQLEDFSGLLNFSLIS